jgi:hypothetical protein
MKPDISIINDWFVQSSSFKNLIQICSTCFYNNFKTSWQLAAMLQVITFNSSTSNGIVAAKING